MTVSAPIFVLSFTYLVFVLAGQLFYKKAAASVSTETLGKFLSSLAFNPQLWLATVLYVGAMVIWVLILKYLPLNRIFPIMTAMLMLSLPLLTYYFLNEPLSLRYWLGVMLILLGIALIATELPENTL